MAKYKLHDGTEFDVKPAGIGLDADALFSWVTSGGIAELGGILSDKETKPHATLDPIRRALLAVLPACCPPEIVQRMMLVDVRDLPLGDILEDALPGIYIPASEDDDDSKNAPTPGANGSGQVSEVAEPTPAG